MKDAVLIFLICLTISQCAFSQPDTGPEHNTDGTASYYAKKFQGRVTANGEVFNNYDYTAAHRTLPFNTYVNVINQDNNLNIIVRINDRGPYAKNRVIDLSEASARRLGGYHHGLVPVKLEVLNIIQLTPELEKAFHSAPVVDCLGNVASLKGYSISLWTTSDLLHAIYCANDLYLKEDVDRVFIRNKIKAGKRVYSILLTGIKDEAAAAEMKSNYENKGFVRAKIIEPQ